MIYHRINKALADSKRVKIKTLISKTINYDGEHKGVKAPFAKNHLEEVVSVNTVTKET